MVNGRDSYRQCWEGNIELDAHSDSDICSGTYYGPVVCAIEEARRLVHNDMENVVERFWEARTATIKQEKQQVMEGGKPHFISLTLSVTNIKGTSIARWVDIHSKHGRKTGVVARRTLKSTGNYHLASLKRGVPDSLHIAIEAAELELRKLRKYQRQLSLAKRRLQEKPTEEVAPRQNLDELDWSWAQPPTRTAPPVNLDEFDWSWAVPPERVD